MWAQGPFPWLCWPVININDWLRWMQRIYSPGKRWREFEIGKLKWKMSVLLLRCKSLTEIEMYLNNILVSNEDLEVFIWEPNQAHLNLIRCLGSMNQLSLKLYSNVRTLSYFSVGKLSFAFFGYWVCDILSMWQSCNMTVFLFINDFCWLQKYSTENFFGVRHFLFPILGCLGTK